MLSFIKKLGPGLLFAGAAIGVSHLVQSTKAGAEFGYGLLWALLIIHLVKYPFFQFAPRYTTATGENLIDGYRRLGKYVLVIYFILTIVTMFTIQAAVTIVTAGLAANLFGFTESDNVLLWSVALLVISAIILYKGRYSLLDKLMKIIVVVLTLTSIIAVVVAFVNTNKSFSLLPSLPNGSIEIMFLIAFLGWMPAPLDVSIWQSIWTQEKQKAIGNTFDTKQSIFDFNTGYFGTILTGILFMSLGALMFFESGESLSPKAGVFANQLIAIYDKNLGSVIGWIVGIAAFTTMFSTTITALDASPKAMVKTVEIFRGKPIKNNYLIWLIILVLGTLYILAFQITNMGQMIKIATIISFVTTPFYAIANLWLVSSKHMPKKWRPSLFMKIWSLLGILSLIGFSIWFLIARYT
jgi:Mn2+/Fe2+ NRAMP family transporter